MYLKEPIFWEYYLTENGQMDNGMARLVYKYESKMEETKEGELVIRNHGR